METTITICGWVLLGTIVLALATFVIAALWGAGFLGFHLSTRFIRERRGWKKAIQESNHQITHYAAIVMCDRLGYGRNATLQEIITDTKLKINTGKRNEQQQAII